MDNFPDINRLILENKRLQTLLKDSESNRDNRSFNLQKLDFFLENAPMAVIDFDINLSVTAWNKSAETVFGYSKNEAIGKSIFDLIIPESEKEAMHKIIISLFEQKGGTRNTNKNICKNKDIIICEWYNTPLINSEGSVIRISAMAYDISEKIKSKNDLIESDRRYKMLSELTLEGILIHKEGIAVEVNPSLEKLTLYSREEIIGKNIVDLLVAEESKAFAQAGINTKTTEPYELRLKKKNGETAWFEIVGRNIIYKGEELRAVALRDIEQRKIIDLKLQKALVEAQESDRLKSTFLSTISHELRTPLNAVIGFSDLIDMTMEKEEIVSLAKMIFSSGNHLLEIINDIFDLSMLEEGNLVLHKEPYNIHALLDEIQEYILREKTKLKKNNLNLIFRIDPLDKDIQIVTDNKRFKQIYIQLLKNALKYTKVGSIEVGFEVLNSEFKFYVKDSGIGIPADKQKYIFERFRQLDDTHTREYEGVGIGLSIAATLCENLGGKISVDSDLGKGSTFYFTHPKEERIPIEQIDAKPKVDLAVLYEKNILIAEDDYDSFELLKMYLKPWTNKIYWAKNGVEAIDIFLSKEPVDLIIMDIKMPVLGGYEATKEIKKYAPYMPIIAQTVFAAEIEKKIAQKAGCDDYITKPINWNELADKMATLLLKK